MDTTSILIKILTKSVKKNGEGHVLTLGHLLGIIKLAKKIEDDKFMGVEPDLYSFDPNWD